VAAVVTGASARAALRSADARANAHQLPLVTVALSADGRSLLSTRAHQLRPWKLPAGTPLPPIGPPMLPPMGTPMGEDRIGAALVRMAASVDGRRAIGASADGAVRVWAVDRGACLHVLEVASAVGGAPREIALSADGRVACVASGSVASLVDVSTGKRMGRLTLPAPPSALTLSPRGDHLWMASGPAERFGVHVLATWSGAAEHAMRGHAASILGLSVSADGSRALSASTDCSARLWARETGACVLLLLSHRGPVTAASLCGPDGGALGVTGSVDKTVRLWDLHTRELGEGSAPQHAVCLRVLDSGHEHAIMSVSASADGGVVASASGGGEEGEAVIRVWEPVAPLTADKLELRD
jgi:WD40 repeat protein